MKKLLYYTTLSILFSISSICAQASFTELNLKGKESLAQKKVDEAEKLFTQSIRQNKDADSYYQLGIIQLSRETFNSRNEALENLKQASLREPENKVYHSAYLKLLEEFAVYSAYGKYLDISKEYPNDIASLIQLGNIKMANYEDYKNSRKIVGEYDARYDYRMSAEAKKDFDESEKYFMLVTKIDSLNTEAFYGLARLYENSGSEKKAVGFLNRIITIKPTEKNAHLFLGMLLHKEGKKEAASQEFNKALELMSESERSEFIYSSVVLLMAPKYEEKLKQLSKEDIEHFVERFWKINNPLILSSINERLLEHYSRMAYANIYFSLPKEGIEGWKTDRGEVLLRYGLPRYKTRTRPFVGGVPRDPYATFKSKNKPIKKDKAAKQDPDTVAPDFPEMKYSANDGMAGAASGVKSEFWIYDNFYLTFDDYYMNGNLRLSWERVGRFSTSLRSIQESFENFGNIKKENIQLYKPKGMQFNINNKIYCFKSLTEKQGDQYDSYLAYELPVRDSLGRINRLISKYETGAFVFGNDLNLKLEKKTNYNREKVSRILASQDNNDKIDNIKFSLSPDSATFVFEIRKLSDSSYYSYRTVLCEHNYKGDKLNISDLILASAVDVNKEIPGAINRNNIHILPKIRNKFKNNEPLYLYYEVYNLRKQSSGLTDYEQVISIMEHKDDESKGGIVSLFKNLLGSDNKVSLSSSYAAKEEDSRQYIQLDIKDYKSGKYGLTITINDKVSGKSIEKKIDFEII